ncbi:ATPase, T2SS/T4P/T4SS family [Paracoccus sp. ME4]|uniref:ATPase, T2SS/T4P/T4SS family n=1 Tax=Paracoccus sp. ME4 TaxID=3138066 RepID=UPI00398B7A5E
MFGSMKQRPGETQSPAVPQASRPVPAPPAVQARPPGAQGAPQTTRPAGQQPAPAQARPAQAPVGGVHRQPTAARGAQFPEQLMPAERGRLAAYNFMDLYISADPFAPIMSRGLRGATLGMTAFGKGLVRIPPELVEDATGLLTVVDRKWKNSNYKREFSIVYDDRSYRCALIAPPEFGHGIDDHDQASRRDVRWCIRQVSPVIPTFADLNLPQHARADLDMLAEMRGLVLISGQFASGKTTLASSVLDHWVAKTRDVGVALEDPPEIPLARVTEDRGVIYQIDLLDRSIRDAIKHARRWSPRYVFLGEVRTSDVAGELMHMSISSPLVVCTIHAADPVQAIMSLFRFASGAMSEDMARDMIAACLQHVFHQEISGGRVKLKSAQVCGADNHLIRSKIKSGNFRGLQEDFDRQVINRNLNA